MKAPKVITQHNYISIDFGNSRRLTASFSGEKASGAVPAEVFNEFSRRVRECKSTVGETVAEFVAEIDKLWPAWATPPRQFAVGDQVEFDFGPNRGGKDRGTVTKVARSISVRFEKHGPIRLAADLLERGA